jgi:hypothetical protein
MSLENYWDLFIHDSDKFNHIGDFGTIFRFRPTEKLTLTAELLLDIGNNGDHNTEVWRGNKNAGRPGISGTAINRLSVSIDYKFAPEWRAYVSYMYSDAFLQRSAYSMGTQFPTITASSMLVSPTNRSQTISGGLEFPVFFDKDLHGYTRCSYDIDQNLVTNASLGLVKKFHCWYVAAECGTGQSWHRHQNGNYSQKLKNYLAISVGLTAMPGLSYGPKVGIGN